MNLAGDDCGSWGTPNEGEIEEQKNDLANKCLEQKMKIMPTLKQSLGK